MKTNIKEKYLPLGTVVLLNGGTKKVMIIGFTPMDMVDNGKSYDYSCCLFPEGLVSDDKIGLFNHNQIKEIIHYGCANEEQIAFNTAMHQIEDRIKREKFSMEDNNGK